MSDRNFINGIGSGPTPPADKEPPGQGPPPGGKGNVSPKNEEPVVEFTIHGLNSRLYMTPTQCMTACAAILKDIADSQSDDYFKGAAHVAYNALQTMRNIIGEALEDGQKKTGEEKP